MAITTLTSREFNQNTGRAKRAASKGPVYITDRGRPRHVLLSFKEYEQLKKNGEKSTILDMLAMPEAAEIDFEPPRLKGLFRPAEFDESIFRKGAERSDAVRPTRPQGAATLHDTRKTTVFRKMP